MFSFIAESINSKYDTKMTKTYEKKAKERSYFIPFIASSASVAVFGVRTMK